MCSRGHKKVPYIMKKTHSCRKKEKIDEEEVENKVRIQVMIQGLRGLAIKFMDRE